MLEASSHPLYRSERYWTKLNATLRYFPNTNATYFDSIHPHYFSVVKLHSDSTYNHPYPELIHGKGGVALLFRKNLRFSVKEIEGIQTDCIVGAKILLQNSTPFSIFGVYLPADSDITY